MDASESRHAPDSPPELDADVGQSSFHSLGNNGGGIGVGGNGASGSNGNAKGARSTVEKDVKPNFGAPGSWNTNKHKEDCQRIWESMVVDKDWVRKYNSSKQSLTRARLDHERSFSHDTSCTQILRSSFVDFEDMLTMRQSHLAILYLKRTVLLRRSLKSTSLFFTAALRLMESRKW